MILRDGNNSTENLNLRSLGGYLTQPAESHSGTSGPSLNHVQSLRGAFWGARLGGPGDDAGLHCRLRPGGLESTPGGPAARRSSRRPNATRML